MDRNRGATSVGIRSANLSDREEVKTAFQTSPEEHPVRVLLATDAAAEGLNLQRHCRYLIHYEIPWNPNRLEQRNGRIDRHGQPAPEVFCLHFLHENRWDSKFLQTVVDKVQQMRHDLGSVSDVIEEGVERRMLGEASVNIAEVSPREAYRHDMRQKLWDNARLKHLAREVRRSREEWELGPEELRSVLDEALKLEGHAGLDEAQGDLKGRGALLRSPPPAWGERALRSVRNEKGHVLTLVFDPDLARDRKDVALVHLNHPLMRRAVSSFRRNMFALGLARDDRLARVSYELAPPGLDTLLLVADVRLLAVGTSGRKLHEEQHSLVFSISQSQLSSADPESLHLLVPGAPFPKIPVHLRHRLETLVRKHEASLREELRSLAEDERGRVVRALRHRAAQQADEVENLIRQRRKEINERLRKVRNQIRSMDPDQMKLELGPDWGADEISQFRIDIRMLERRREELKEELQTEPERIRERFELRNLRAFPLGLRFVIPDSVIKGGM